MIEKVLDRASRGLELVLALAFIFAIMLNFVNVVGRYLFGASILWGDEVQIFIMVAMTFIGIAVVTWRRAHLRMDVLTRLLPRPIQTLLKVLELLLMLVLCSFVLLESADYAYRMYDIGRTSDTAGIPMWIPHGSVALGFALVVLICIWRVLVLVFTGRIEDPVTERSEGSV